MKDHKPEAGAAASEYIMLLAGIAAIAVVGIMLFGVFLHDKWTGTTADVQTQVTTLSSH